ncbi:MAG: adenylate kinase [Phycisphaerales bacterium]
MLQRFRSALLVGPPGAGKGTQGELLGQLPGFFHHSSGDVFRNLSPDTPEGKTFYEYSTKGLLVPDDVTIDVWRANIEAQRVIGAFKPNQELLILDGIPRNANQAKLMDEHVDIVRVVHLVCPDEDAFVERLKQRAKKQNRLDDAKEDVIRKRFEVYKEETRPVLEHYDSSLIEDVDAMGPIPLVLQRCLEALNPVTQPA